jgi:hypothetical protein
MLPAKFTTVQFAVAQHLSENIFTWHLIFAEISNPFGYQFGHMQPSHKKRLTVQHPDNKFPLSTPVKIAYFRWRGEW